MVDQSFCKAQAEGSSPSLRANFLILGAILGAIIAVRVGFLNILTLIFVVAKLAGVVAWPWWAVFLPTIAHVGLVLALLLLVGLIVVVSALVESKKR